MNKRTKARLMKKIENAAATLSCLVLVWGLLSWIDVILHNMTDQDYAWWNLIVLFSKIVVMVVWQSTPSQRCSNRAAAVKKKGLTTSSSCDIIKKKKVVNNNEEIYKIIKRRNFTWRKNSSWCNIVNWNLCFGSICFNLVYLKGRAKQ